MENAGAILELISSFASNPIGAGIGVLILLVVAIGGGVWYNQLKKKWRENRAQDNKQKDKQKDQDDLEDQDSEGHSKLKDRLGRRGKGE